MSKSKTPTPMTPDAARRIQSHADRTDTNGRFKSSATSAAAKHSRNAAPKGDKK